MKRRLQLDQGHLYVLFFDAIQTAILEPKEDRKIEAYSIATEYFDAMSVSKRADVYEMVINHRLNHANRCFSDGLMTSFFICLTGAMRKVETVEGLVIAPNSSTRNVIEVSLLQFELTRRATYENAVYLPLDVGKEIPKKLRPLFTDKSELLSFLKPGFACRSALAAIESVNARSHFEECVPIA